MKESISHESHLNFLSKFYWCILVILILFSLFIQKGSEVLLINGNHTPATDYFFANITRLGEGWLFIPILVILLFIRFKYAIMTVAIAIFHSLICFIAKKILFTNYLRPIKLLDNDLLHFVPGVEVHGYNSFPSGHTATIICISVFISLLIQHRVWNVVLIILALTVAYSRIYLLQHFLVDITAGACIGAFCTFYIWHIFEKLQLPPWTNSSIQLKWQQPKRFRSIKA